eukprot:500501-Prorocentrum_minimum.AAC.3
MCLKAYVYHQDVAGGDKFLGVATVTSLLCDQRPSVRAAWIFKANSTFCGHHRNILNIWKKASHATVGLHSLSFYPVSFAVRQKFGPETAHIGILLDSFDGTEGTTDLNTVGTEAEV